MATIFFGASKAVKEPTTQLQWNDHCRDVYLLFRGWHNKFIGPDPLPDWDELDEHERFIQVETVAELLNQVDSRRITLAQFDRSPAEIIEFKYLQDNYFLLMLADSYRGIGVPMHFAESRHADLFIDMITRPLLGQDIPDLQELYQKDDGVLAIMALLRLTSDFCTGITTSERALPS